MNTLLNAFVRCAAHKVRNSRVYPCFGHNKWPLQEIIDIIDILNVQNYLLHTP